MKILTVKPVVTEKSMRLASDGVYTFLIPKHANKHTVKREIETAFKVTVLAVNIARIPGKVKRRGRITGMTQEKTKAMVRLKVGEKIPGYELAVDAASADEGKKE